MIVVDGGSEAKRAALWRILAMRGTIPNAASSGDAVVKVEMSEVLLQFNSFSDYRYVCLREWSEAPVLVIAEIDSAHQFREKGDGREMFEVLLLRREEGSRPTIFTLSVPSDSFKDSGALGRRFQTAIASEHAPECGIYRARAQT